MVLVVIGTAAALVALGGVAWAYWSAQAANVPTYSQADSMNTGARPTATASGNSVTVNWPVATTANGHAVGGYLVDRYASAIGGTAIPAAHGTCASNPVTSTSCVESSVPAGAWYYTVTPMLGNWHGAESPRSTAVTAMDTYALSVPGSLTAGTATTLTVTATIGGQPDTGYSGTKTLAFSGPGTSPNGTAPTYDNGHTSVTFSAGVANVPMTLFRAETPTLNVTATDATGSLGLTVKPAGVNSFLPVTPSTDTAGTAQSVAVTADDAYGNTATTYAGNKTLTWSGPSKAPSGQSPSYPNPVTFTGGAANVSVTLYDAQTTSLTVTDGSISGTSASFTVISGAASRFSLTQPGQQAAGVAFNVTLTVLDAYGNTVTGYTSGNLTFSGPGDAPDGTTPTYPSNPVTFAGGTATVSITLFKAESTTLAVSAGSVTGQTSSKVTVNAGAPTNLAWTSVTAGGGLLSSPCLFTCTATGMNNQTFSARVSVTDTHGNIVSELGGSNKTVTVTATGAAPLGSFTAPSSGTTVTLTIPASGAATSTKQLAFKAPNGNWTTTNTLTATGDYAQATATLSH